MGAPSLDEKATLDKLRDRLRDVLPQENDAYTRSDIFLVRFLRAREGNIDAAEKMLRATLAWRHENNVDALSRQPLNEFCTTNFPVIIDGRDRVGRPVVIVPVGKWDLHKANLDEERINQFRIYNLQMYERIIAEIQSADRERTGSVPITQYTVIYDWLGFSYRPLFNISLDKRMAQLTATVEANYPETLANCVYINCASFISTVLSILKPVMSSKTFGRIKQFNTDRSVWVPALQELVDPGQLPPQYGGTRQPHQHQE